MAGTTFDIVVIGGGIAADTAAHHAALAGVSVLQLAGDGLPGGLVANVGALDGYPSAAPVSGAALAQRLAEENAALGVRRLDVTADEMVPGKTILVRGGGQTWQARQAILATGARLRTLDVPGAAHLQGRGVSQCAWCDGGLYRGADVVVAGGGDAALSEALHLAAFARRITIVTRGERLRARQAYVTRVAEDERFELRWECDIAEVVGSSGVEAVRITDRSSGDSEEIACSGLFVFIGLEPQGALPGGAARRDAAGGLITDAAFETSIPGLFAVGAVRSGYGGRLTNAVGEATAAAELAARRCLD